MVDVLHYSPISELSLNKQCHACVLQPPLHCLYFLIHTQFRVRIWESHLNLPKASILLISKPTHFLFCSFGWLFFGWLVGFLFVCFWFCLFACLDSFFFFFDTRQTIYQVWADDHKQMSLHSLVGCHLSLRCSGWLCVGMSPKHGTKKL